jgi:hypothetical protein
MPTEVCSPINTMKRGKPLSGASKPVSPGARANPDNGGNYAQGRDVRPTAKPRSSDAGASASITLTRDLSNPDPFPGRR